jgi:hypothetical protein
MKLEKALNHKGLKNCGGQDLAIQNHNYEKENKDKEATSC